MVNWLANLKVWQKIYLILALVSLVAIGVGLFGLNGMNSSNKELKTVYEDRVVPLKQLKVIADKYAVNIVDTCHKVRNGNLSWADGIKNIDESNKIIKEQWSGYKATKLIAKEEAFVKEAEPLMQKADVSVTRAREFMQRQDKEALANYTIMELYQNIDPISGKISELVDLQLEVAKQEYDTAQQDYQTLRSTFIGVLVGGIGLALLIAFFIVRMITTQISTMINSIHRDANGYITVKEFSITSQDEIGQLGEDLNTLIAQVRGFVKQVSGSTDLLAASSEQLTASSEQSAQASNQIASTITSVAAGANEQMNAANETSAVVEQMSAGIQQVAANANLVAAHSAQAADKARDGSKEVEKAVNQMNQIEQTVDTSARVVAKLGERSKEIGQIVDTISGIAGQTNLLALNAAIEAARAGEQGRGFAVVAEEVRKLAEQSQYAAKQIATLIGEIQDDTDKAVVAMNDGTREVRTGAEVVNATGVAFQEIVDLVTEVSGQVKEISAGIQQMATGSQQIVGSVKKVDNLSKKSAGEAQGVSAATEEQLASMEEIAGSSQALAKLAQELQEAVARFNM